MRQRASQLLQQVFGCDACFRDGQWEAIDAVVNDHARLLVVQRTGWGKSLVYFMATKLLRERGAGPTVLVSPLLSLMRNQIDMAGRLGVKAASLNCTNTADWEDVKRQLSLDDCDILVISPERLADERFVRAVLPSLPGGIGMMVIDEAHCISDWGHDFRPDYRRIVRIVQSLPRRTPVLATTATANDRVVNDVVSQLGSDLVVLRGPLARRGLRLQTIEMDDQAQRMAWLAEHLPEIPGTGIIYCLTVADCTRVATWLRENGVDAHEYHARLPNEMRVMLENRLLRNELKALVATVALGMGFDKPDLGFVIHYQRPGSIVSYYQQVGRAGRALETACAILLGGAGDDEILEHFISSAFPDQDVLSEIVGLLDEAVQGSSLAELAMSLNFGRGVVEGALKTLAIDGAVTKDGNRYYRSLTPWSQDLQRIRQISAIRRHELSEMQAFMSSRRCLMQRITDALNDPHSQECGICAVCAGDFVPRAVHPEHVLSARRFLRSLCFVIAPRRQWPSGLEGPNGRIAENLRLQEGRCLGLYGDSGWGSLVRKGKYEDGVFSMELAQGAAKMIVERWRPTPFPSWVTAVPSRNRPALVVGLGKQIAELLGLPFHQAIAKTAGTPPQKTRNNSQLQCANARAGFSVTQAPLPGPVLLVDDIVDSRWTLTVCGALLRDAGSGIVYPFALVSAYGGGDTE